MPIAERFLIIGLGSIGKRHARNIKFLFPNSIVMALRSGTQGTPIEGVDFQCFSMEEALQWKPNYAIVATPSSHHIGYAKKLIENKIPVLIEKPISNSLNGVSEIIELSEKQQIRMMVGYCLRFHRPLVTFAKAIRAGEIGIPYLLHMEVGQNLLDWRPHDVHSISGRLETGGGVLLELSHEIDFACDLFGEVSSVVASTDRLTDLVENVEDVADVILKFKSGVRANIHLDMIQRPSRRRWSVTGSLGQITWDRIDESVTLWSNQSPKILFEGPVDRNEMYLEELMVFVLNAKIPLGMDGASCLKIVLAAKESAECAKVISLNSISENVRKRVGL